VELVNKILSEAEKNYTREYDAATILIYHRVVELDSDPQLLAVKPKHFEEQMRYLRENFLIISLQELVKCLSQGNVPQNSVVITFDDGYADNLYNAKPILEKYGVPATVFVASGLVGSTREFWWDELEKIFLLNISRTKPLEIEFNGQQLVWPMDSAEKVRKTYLQVHWLLKQIPHSFRKNFIDALYPWSGAEKDVRDSHRTLTASELQQLALGGLIEIGAHTVNHVVLARESPERQYEEIVTSKQALENILGMSVNSFSYPFGDHNDVSDSTPALVQKAGFNCGIANINGNVYPNASLYWLPRRLVRDWNIHEFQAFMEINKRSEQSKIFSYAKERFLEALKKLPNLESGVSQTISLSGKCEWSSDKVQPNSNTLSVLQLNAVDHLGGAARIALDIHTNMRERGHNMRMLVDRMGTNDKDIQILPPVRNESQWLLSSIGLDSGWLDLFHLSSFMIPRTDYFKESQILHLHNLHPSFFSYLALPNLSRLKPTIWTLHDMQAFTGHCAHSLDCDKWTNGCEDCPYLGLYPRINKNTSAVLWQLKKAIYEECKLTVVCPSDWLKQKVEQSILCTNKIEVIYNGVDEITFHNHDKNYAKQKLQLPTDKLIILFSADGGITNPWKGGDYVKNLYSHFRERGDFLFINLGGKEMKRDNDWIDFEYTADKRKLALLYSAADILLYPSIADNCPLVVLEALSCGTPVLAFKTGGIPELIEHLETGYVAQYRDLSDLANGFATFIARPDWRKAASEKARQAVLERFTQERMLQKYQTLYKDLISSHC
jgi:glycosyltransferase involved in cell wall biosynthesis/peptidoglycan/xylan/chitin deacetylase (PgdA/CDA1 family)